MRERLLRVMLRNMLGQKPPDRFDLLHLRPVKIRALANSVRDGHGIEIQQQLQNLHFEVRDADLFRHPVQFSEDVLRLCHTVQHLGARAEGKARDDPFRRDREVRDLFRQRPADDIQIKGDRQAVTMTGGEGEIAGVLLPQVKLYPSATSSIIMMLKPTAKNTVPILE